MDSLDQKTFHTTRGMTWNYYTSKPASQNSRPPLLLIHGFPDTPLTCYSSQIPFLTAQGYHLILPTLLGFSPSSLPTDVEAYNSEDVTADLVEILDVEKVEKVVVIGHDVGALYAYHLGLWHPSRVIGSINLGVADMPAVEVPGGVDTWIAGSKAGLGYEALSYFKFFISPAAAGVIEGHLDSFFDVMYGRDNEQWKILFSHYQEMEGFIMAGKRQEVAEWATAEKRGEFIERFQNQGISAALNYYKVLVENVHWNREKKLPEARRHLDYPGLFIGAERDPVCTPAAVERMKPLRDNLTIRSVDAAHWLMLDRPEEVNQIIKGWLEKMFP